MPAVMPDFADLFLSYVINLLDTYYLEIINQSHSWIVELKSDPNHNRHDRVSLMVLEKIAVKFYKTAKSGNTVCLLLSGCILQSGNVFKAVPGSVKAAQKCYFKA